MNSLGDQSWTALPFQLRRISRLNESGFPKSNASIVQKNLLQFIRRKTQANDGFFSDASWTINKIQCQFGWLCIRRFHQAQTLNGLLLSAVNGMPDDKDRIRPFSRMAMKHCHRSWQNSWVRLGKSKYLRVSVNRRLYRLTRTVTSHFAEIKILTITASKMLKGLILRRPFTAQEWRTGGNQTGFRPSRGCIHHLYDKC